MTDKINVNAIGKSEAEIAYQLLQHVSSVEGKSLYGSRDNPGNVADRDYIIKTFAACMMAVKQPGYHL